MIEIENKIESIRNMKNDLNSIKLTSQKNADRMLRHLADFRNRICNEMSKIESNYQSGRNCAQTRPRTRQSGQRYRPMLNSDSDCHESDDLKGMSEMLLKWENHSLMSSTQNDSNVSSNRNEHNPSVDTLNSIPTTGKVNILFSKQFPYAAPDPLPTASEVKSKIASVPVDRVENQVENEKFSNENQPMTRKKIDKLTKKLKEIQTQNDELRNVNENIQNLLLKLSDLKYADASDVETVDKLDTVRKESQVSSHDDSYHDFGTTPETIMKTESYQQCTRSVEITNTTRNNMLTKINVAKLIIKRMRSYGNIADHEHKYKVRVRQAEQSITLKAHHNKPQ